MGSKVKREENRKVEYSYLCSYDEDVRYKRRLVDGISNIFYKYFSVKHVKIHEKIGR